LSNPRLTQLCHDSKFLVIDDFENFRTSLRLMLTSFGASSVDTASNAEEALNLSKYKAFDVILCDYNLGTQKNGHQILEELRHNKRLKRTHLFIMITADTSKEVVLGTRELQPDAYIAKPVTRSLFEERLLQLLSQQHQLKPINQEIELENYAKAISLCQQELDHNTHYKTWCLRTMAELFEHIGDSSSAQQIYKDALKDRSVDWAQVGLGRTLLHSGQYERAKQVFESAVKRNPHLVEAYDGISDCCIKLGDDSIAQLALEQATKISPQIASRQTALGHLSMKASKLSTACNAFRQAIINSENTFHDKPELYLDMSRSLVNLASVQTDEEKQAPLLDEANEQLSIVLERFPNDETANLCANLITAQILALKNNTNEAVKLIDDVETLSDFTIESPELGVELAKALLAVRKHNEAQALLLQLIKEFEQNDAVRSEIEALIDEPEPLRQCVNARKFHQQGLELLEQGRQQEALDALSSAVALTPKNATLNLNLAQTALWAYQTNHDKNILDTAHDSVERLSSLPQQHKQYARLVYVRNILSHTR